MDVKRFVDTSGDIPRLKVGLLATSLVGTVVYGWLNGFIGFVDAWLAGWASLPRRLGSWLTDDLLPALFAVARDPMAAAWASNAEFVGSLGAFGIVVAVLEVAFVVWILMVVIERLLRFVRVVTP